MANLEGEELGSIVVPDGRRRKSTPPGGGHPAELPELGHVIQLMWATYIIAASEWRDIWGFGGGTANS